MDVANLLSNDPPQNLPSQHATDHTQQEAQRVHQYPTRQSVMSNNMSLPDHKYNALQAPGSHGERSQDNSEGYGAPSLNPAPKHVAFELLFDGGSNHRARLPMRVQIYPHDTTDSIVTTVKNWYGLYEGAAKGIGFEDDRGNTLIASYENFKNNMVVCVRKIPDYSQSWQSQEQIAAQPSDPNTAQRTPHLDEAFEMPPPQSAQLSHHAQPISRPASRVARKLSVSPRLSNRRSVSAQKGRSRSGIKSREDTFQQLDELNNDVTKGYSSSDGEAGSVTSSRKARNEQLASAEISLENIVEGGRRQRAKFESSELPLFVPPQVPAANSISSISPQRRSNGQDNPSPFAKPTQHHFSWNQPLQSPQSYGYGEHPHGIIPASANSATRQPSTAQHGHRLRDRVNAPTLSSRPLGGPIPRGQGFGILPTPDPTIASCISDEDVALQLMRLGDASNISHGRTSASTMDDALSGRADVASSATSDSEDESDEDEQPIRPTSHTQTKQEAQRATSRKQSKHLDNEQPAIYSSDVSADEMDGEYSHTIKKDNTLDEDLFNELGQPAKRAKSSNSKASRSTVPKARNNSTSKMSGNTKSRTSTSKKPKLSALSSASSKVPLSPASLPPQSRKTSSASTTKTSLPLGADDEDLSTKPRCQRCRKSKKGCNRQRPCQRCKDAGIGAEGCISEDEGNGRKGRFGRHMGVSVHKEHQASAMTAETEEAGAILDGMAGAQEKSKKRKR